MTLDPHIIPRLKPNELWHSNTCHICDFDDLAWFDHLLKGSKVTNQLVCLVFLLPECHFFISGQNTKSKVAKELQ